MFVIDIATKSECLDRMILGGGDPLDCAIREFMIHDHAERSHDGLKNAVIVGGPTTGEGRVQVNDRLGGLPKDYYREAAWLFVSGRILGQDEIEAYALGEGHLEIGALPRLPRLRRLPRPPEKRRLSRR
jgi:hypothetical protein